MTNHEDSESDESTDLGDFADYDPEDYERKHPMWKYEDRKRSVLTERDRDLIWGDLELEGQKLRDAQYRIRERVRDGLLDIEGISFRLDNEELEKIVERLEERDGVQNLQGISSHEAEIAIKALLRLALKIQQIHCRNQETQVLSELEDNFEIVFDKFYGPGKLSIKYDEFNPDTTQEELTEKITEGEASEDEFKYHLLNYGYEPLIELMEEKEMEGFVIFRDEGPNHYYSLEGLKGDL